MEQFKVSSEKGEISQEAVGEEHEEQRLIQLMEGDER